MPHEQGTCLGGPFTILENSDPAEPIVSGAKFTAFLLAAMDEVAASDGSRIQLYTLVPLYPEEVALERREDLPTLLNALDAAHISYTVDMNRPNVGT